MAGGILILAEHLKGNLLDTTFELLGAGRKLADALGSPLSVAVFSDDAASLTGPLGAADKVLVVEDLHLATAPASTAAALLVKLLEQQQASLILVGGTNVSMGIGTFVSARAGLPCVNFCRGLRVEDGAVIATSQLFGGKIFADVRLPEARGVITVCPGAFPADAGRSDRAPTVEKTSIPVEVPRELFQKYIEPEAGDVDISKHDVLVAVGRGIQTQDNLTLAEDLATALGGVVCASRPVIDQGWLPLSRQVGKSGLCVKPKLYVALGISGAPEHVEGMQSSQLIVAINTDPHAPIFDIAHYGVCGDLLEIVPALTDKIKARKA
ncbi:MAG: electron transfer flavoprotein subunit alpha/FixB family protein [Verrucomicrobiota bacterium]